MAERTRGSADRLGAPFPHYPFERTTVPILLESASFDYDEIVTEDDRSYAGYIGETLDERTDASAMEQRSNRSPVRVRISQGGDGLEWSETDDSTDV